MNKLYLGCLYLAAAAALLVLPALLLGRGRLAAGTTVVLFAALAVGIRGTSLKGLSFTMWIIAAVVTSMLYPAYFTSIGGFRLSRLIVPLMQIIMFGMGTAMSVNDFVSVVRMPKGVIVGMLCQFSIMPLVGFSLAKLFGFPSEIAAGVVLIGSAPCGLASNVMNYIAGNNLALAVTLTACATLAAPVMTPLMMKLLAGTLVEVVFLDMMIDIIYMVIIPIGAGLTLNHYAHNRIRGSEARKHVTLVAVCALLSAFIGFLGADVRGWARIGTMLFWLSVTLLITAAAGAAIQHFARGNTAFLNRTMPVLSMAGIAYIITIITAAGRDNLLQIGITLLLASMLHNTLGYIFGYWGSRMLRMNKLDSRTIAIEVGLQNGGLASGLALQMGKVATVGLAPAIFGPWMNISGSALANYWRTRPVADRRSPGMEEVVGGK